MASNKKDAPLWRSTTPNEPPPRDRLAAYFGVRPRTARGIVMSIVESLLDLCLSC